MMFGKILVSTHVGLSLIFATWAMVLYVTRVNYSNTPGKGATPDGELVARVAEYERLTKNDVRPLDTRWRDGRRQLEAHELYRTVERPWYDSQLEFLRTGAKEDNPVRQLERDAAGNPVVVENPRAGADLLKMGPPRDKEGKPLLNRAGQPLALKSLELYNREYDATQGEITVELKLLQKAAERDLRATELLKGPKGLHARISFERTKQERVKEEFEEVRPLMLKTAVELQNLRQLALRLQLRLGELRGSRSNE